MGQKIFFLRNCLKCIYLSFFDVSCYIFAFTLIFRLNSKIWPNANFLQKSFLRIFKWQKRRKTPNYNSLRWLHAISKKKNFWPMIPVSCSFGVTKVHFYGSLRKKISITALKQIIFSGKTLCPLQLIVNRSALAIFVQKIWASENQKIPTLRPQISKTIRCQELKFIG